MTKMQSAKENSSCVYLRSGKLQSQFRGSHARALAAPRHAVGCAYMAVCVPNPPGLGKKKLVALFK